MKIVKIFRLELFHIIWFFFLIYTRQPNPSLFLNRPKSASPSLSNWQAEQNQPKNFDLFWHWQTKYNSYNQVALRNPVMQYENNIFVNFIMQQCNNYYISPYHHLVRLETCMASLGYLLSEDLQLVTIFPFIEYWMNWSWSLKILFFFLYSPHRSTSNSHKEISIWFFYAFIECK